MKWLWKFLIVLVATVTTVGVVSDHAGARGGRGGGRGGGKGGRGGGKGGRGGGGRGGGGRSAGMENRKDVVKDLENRRLQLEKEERILEVRAEGAEKALDEMLQAILDDERNKAASNRRAEWRSRANPG